MRSRVRIRPPLIIGRKKVCDDTAYWHLALQHSELRYSADSEHSSKLKTTLGIEYNYDQCRIFYCILPRPFCYSYVNCRFSERCFIGATTLSVMTFSRMTLSIIMNKSRHSAYWDCYAERRLCWVSLMLSDTYKSLMLRFKYKPFMLSVTYKSFMLRVTFKPFMLSVTALYAECRYAECCGAVLLNIHPPPCPPPRP